MVSIEIVIKLNSTRIFAWLYSAGMHCPRRREDAFGVSLTNVNGKKLLNVESVSERHIRFVYMLYYSATEIH